MEDINVQIYNQPEKAKVKLPVVKIIFIILGIIILVELVYFAKNLTSPASSPIPFLPATNTVTKSEAKISLTASNLSFKVGEVVPVSVMIDTGSWTVSGVDLVVKFDPKALEVTSKDLTKGTLFDDYPLIAADADKGIISISGVSNSKNGFKGLGQFALLNLKANLVGKTVLTVDFKKDSTAYTNLVEMKTAKNILEKVDNLEINIQ
ncbi:hypothetical protein HYU93_00530 [Candidatus Daviesbacteria bacterium]|nr:hypothetical protein [Candidatus Daviesbacteria bacterium]